MYFRNTYIALLDEQKEVPRRDKIENLKILKLPCCISAELRLYHDCTSAMGLNYWLGLTEDEDMGRAHLIARDLILPTLAIAFASPPINDQDLTQEKLIC